MTRTAASGLLAQEIRWRIGPPSELPEWPLVSMIVLNRNGAEHLRRLLSGLTERTDYPRFELIVVDNASSDDSLDLLRSTKAPFPISVVANHRNESFSDGCNRGSELAAGELLLFLNNDIEPFEMFWLRELVACRARTGAAAVAATLLCDDEEHRASFRYGYGVQHRGHELREEEDGMIHPVLHGWEADPLDERLGVDRECPSVAAACLLADRDAFERVGGFSHGYVYGAEDVDLSLKLRSTGWNVSCSGRSVAIHHPASTRRSAPFEEERARKRANRLLLWDRWGPLMRREYELSRAGEDPQARAAVEPPTFCLKAPALESAQRHHLQTIGSALAGDHRPCPLLEGDRAEDPIALNHDVAVHWRGPERFVPKPGQLNVLWPTEEASEIECSHYDLVATSSRVLVSRLDESRLAPPVALLPPPADGAHRVGAALRDHALARLRAANS